MVDRRVGRGDAVLLGGQHVVGPGVVQRRVADPERELLRGQHIVRALVVKRRVDRGHAELLRGQHVARLVVVGLLGGCHDADHRKSPRLRQDASRPAAPPHPRACLAVRGFAPDNLSHVD